MATITLMVGPPGSGKSTLAKERERLGGVVRVSQDDHGKQGHMDMFEEALKNNHDVIVDRMNFDKSQRNRYLDPAKKLGYSTRIMVVHTPLRTCLERCNARVGHPTIQDSKSASQAVNFFFSKYERVEDNEADEVFRLGWVDVTAPKAIICDLDGTLCNVEHRRHFVRPPEEKPQWEGPFGKLELPEEDKPKFKKNWPAFFAGIKDDTVNQWCADLLKSMSSKLKIVYCSGRGDNERRTTIEWLEKHDLTLFTDGDSMTYQADLFMRNRQDQRRDDVVKEIILDFEILTRYNPAFMIDDRQQVVDMWRKRGFTCLQCDVGDF